MQQHLLRVKKKGLTIKLNLSFCQVTKLGIFLKKLLITTGRITRFLKKVCLTTIQI